MVKCPVDSERARISAMSATATRRDQCQTAKEVMAQLNGVEVNEKKGEKLRFRMYITREMWDTPIDDLELSVRSYHSLKRAGMDTIGDIAEAVSRGMDLGHIRNCGAKSRREIQERLFLFQYYSLKESRREAYLKEVVELNK